MLNLPQLQLQTLLPYPQPPAISRNSPALSPPPPHPPSPPDLHQPPPHPPTTPDLHHPTFTTRPSPTTTASTFNTRPSPTTPASPTTPDPHHPPPTTTAHHTDPHTPTTTSTPTVPPPTFDLPPTGPTPDLHHHRQPDPSFTTTANPTLLHHHPSPSNQPTSDSRPAPCASTPNPVSSPRRPCGSYAMTNPSDPRPFPSTRASSPPTVGAVSGWPDSAEKWREATAVFGAADWDTGVLADAKVVDAGTDGLRERLASGDRHALDQTRTATAGADADLDGRAFRKNLPAGDVAATEALLRAVGIEALPASPASTSNPGPATPRPSPTASQPRWPRVPTPRPTPPISPGPRRPRRRR